jgi:hypothetical protein
MVLALRLPQTTISSKQRPHSLHSPFTRTLARLPVVLAIAAVVGCGAGSDAVRGGL